MGGAAAASMGPALSRSLPRVPTALHQGVGICTNARLADSLRALLPCTSSIPNQCSFAPPSFHVSNSCISQSSLGSSSALTGDSLFAYDSLSHTANPHQRHYGSSIRAEKVAGSTALKTPSVSAPSSKKQALIDTQPPRGTRDFPPEEMRLRMWLFNHFREVRALIRSLVWIEAISVCRFLGFLAVSLRQPLGPLYGLDIVLRAVSA